MKQLALILGCLILTGCIGSPAHRASHPEQYVDGTEPQRQADIDADASTNRERLDAITQQEKDQKLTKWQAIAQRTAVVCGQRGYKYCGALPSLALMLDEKVKGGAITDAEAQYRYDQALVEMETRNAADEQRRRAEILQMMPLLMRPPPPVYVTFPYP